MLKTFFNYYFLFHWDSPQVPANQDFWDCIGELIFLILQSVATSSLLSGTGFCDGILCEVCNFCPCWVVLDPV